MDIATDLVKSPLEVDMAEEHASRDDWWERARQELNEEVDRAIIRDFWIAIFGYLEPVATGDDCGYTWDIRFDHKTPMFVVWVVTSGTSYNNGPDYSSGYFKFDGNLEYLVGDNLIDRIPKVLIDKFNSEVAEWTTTL